MNNTDKIHQKLKEQGVKMTEQRRELLRILEDAHRPMTAEEIFFQLKVTTPDVCLATVYRNMELLVSRGVVRQLQLSGKSRVYELIGDAHHHYLVCLSCNKTVKLEDCPLHQYEAKVVANTDFTITEHRLAMYGYCPQCKPKD